LLLSFSNWPALSQDLLGVESHRIFPVRADAAYYRQTAGKPVTISRNFDFHGPGPLGHLIVTLKVRDASDVAGL